MLGSEVPPREAQGSRDAQPSAGQVTATTIISAENLAAELRQLVRSAEQRSGRKIDRASLAQAVHVSPQSLYAYFSGSRLPPAATLDALLIELGAGGDQLRRLAGLRDQVEDGRRSARSRPDLHAPRGLPADFPGFVGRRTALDHLDAALAVHTDKPTITVLTIVGAAGVGKTTLAVHWAHQVAHRFRDGQLHVNLRGYDPAGPTIGSSEALYGFLEALGVPAQRIPETMHARASLYRSVLADRRVLIVLDNARDVAQVDALIPASPASLVLVTSRNELTGLTAASGARPIRLDLISVAEARLFLQHRLGVRRVLAEPHAADEIIHCCARLPLALAVAAARASVRPHLALARLAEELRSTGDALDTLTGDDPSTDVRTVFSWSYLALTPEAARLFRLIGLHPGSDVSKTAAASLAGTTRQHIQPVLAELTRAHLLTEGRPDRFSTHDLLRAYAIELAGDLAAHDRHDAIHRLFDHYLHTAYAADRLLDAQRDPITLPPAHPGVVPEHLADRAQALAWLDAELATLLTAISSAMRLGFDTHTWQLTWALTTFLDYQGHLQRWAEALHAALAASQRLGDLRAQAYAHRILGSVCTRLDHPHDGESHFRRALDVYHSLGDPVGQAHAHIGLCSVLDRQGQYPRALADAQKALDLYRAANHQAGLANALAVTGWLQTQLGAHDDAVRYCEQALKLLEELGDLAGQAGAWDSLGDARCRLGQRQQGITCYQRSIDLCRQVGDRHLEADALTHLSEAYHAIGRHNAAHAARRQAQEIQDSLERIHPTA